MGNVEIAINHLKLLVLSEEQIAEANIDYTELIEVRLGDEVFAPIWMATLKTHLKHFPNEGELFEVIIYQSSDNWSSLYKHHFFQRRQSSLDSAEGGNRDVLDWILHWNHRWQWMDLHYDPSLHCRKRHGGNQCAPSYSEAT